MFVFLIVDKSILLSQSKEMTVRERPDIKDPCRIQFFLEVFHLFYLDILLIGYQFIIYFFYMILYNCNDVKK